MDTTHDPRQNLTTGADHKGTNRPLELLDDYEIRLLDEAMRTSHRTSLGYRNRLALRLMAGAGLRVSEVLSLEPGDIDTATGNVRVTGKGGKTRITRLPASDMALLRSWMKRRPEGAERLVCREDGEPMAPSALRQTIKRAAERAGIRKEVRCHSFRHRFAVTLANDNVPVPHISRLLGHSSVATTQHYLAGLSLEDALDALTERVTV
jgi:site-specific recombinase XerD